MFRNPRENAGQTNGAYTRPSVGRPPSPPTTPGTKATPPAITPALSTSRMAAAKASPIPTIGRGSTNPRKSSLANAKPKGKPNGSILSFFKKADDGEENLFVKPVGASPTKNGTEEVESWEDDYNGSPVKKSPDSRYNEDGGSVKRRKLSPEKETTDVQIKQETTAEDFTACSPPPPENQRGDIPPPPRSDSVSKAGVPFVEDSDSEDEGDSIQLITDVSPIKQEPQEMQNEITEVMTTTKVPLKDPDEGTGGGKRSRPRTPALSREATSMSGADGFAEFGDEDFEDDVFEEGDEFLERRYMEEQEQFEAEHDDGPDEEGDTSAEIKTEETDQALEAPSCPICDVRLAGITDQEAAVHVNNCLDGNPTPLPIKQEATPAAPLSAKDGANRFRKVPRAPRPGQAIPFALGGGPGSTGGSAFSKLMSGHAEDAAWADAAEAEKQSRGKPSYTRTCPFYKIMPGFNICVDAFRYGAVQGCQAYFLSHFHSDHYIGLTSTWCHGPIYASKVTTNLIKQQLRVDPKWVIALEFDQKVEVPGTNGVFVTMIPANHCPGSSLYLFEKVVGKGARPKVQRVLHCGDFRACKAHVEHPLLRPDVIDAVSGKERQQKIDVCYLDTTYLNPKYAFPQQEDVIQACADMCVSLSKVRTDENDGWEQMKRERAGAGMVKFIRQGSDVAIKEEPEEGASSTGPISPDSKTRGRLLVVVGTYSIGKERICLGIAHALKSKIYCPPGKKRICLALEDPEITSLLTDNPHEAQVHMTPLFEIRADTLDDYLKDYRGTFARAVGFRPTGWSYRPPNSRFVESPSVQTVLYSDNWKSTYGMKDLVPQRGSTSRASCFGVPYSEHSSFRELTMFCCALRIEKIVPTVNVGSAKGRERMKAWCDKWAVERRKNGVFRLPEGERW
ncbi:hypothetical protein MBLNU457_g0747t1 [Dothideomycetes sp. NU457]